MGKLLVPLLAAFLSLSLLLTEARAQEGPAYLALGDSLAFGVGASDPAATGYVGLTHDALRKSDRYRERGLGLVNLSAPGATPRRGGSPRPPPCSNDPTTGACGEQFTEMLQALRTNLARTVEGLRQAAPHAGNVHRRPVQPSP